MKKFIALIILFSTWIQLTAQQKSGTLLDDPSLFGKTNFEKEASEEFAERLELMQYFSYLYEEEGLNQYLNGILAKVTPESIKDLPIRIYVSNSTVPNAYAYIDGSIVINLALLADFETEEEIAFVIAHELAHIIMRHGIVKAAKTKTMSAAERKELLSKTLKSQSLENYSQQAEFEADSLAVVLLAKSEYNTDGALRALNNLGTKDDTKKKNKFGEILIRILTVDITPDHAYIKTHPNTSDRIKRVKRISKKVGTNTPDIDAELYQLAIDNAMIQLLDEYRAKRATSEVLEKIDMLVTSPAFYSDERQAHIQLVRAEIIYDLYINQYEAGYFFRLHENSKKDPKKQKSFVPLKKKDAEFTKWVEEQKKETIAILNELSEMPDAQRILGLFALADNNKSQGREYISNYLSMAPTSPGAFYYRNLLKSI